MRANLCELLGYRNIEHPTLIEKIEWSGEALTLSVRGAAWWKGPYAENPEQGAVQLVFNGIGEGVLLSGGFELTDDKALEEFSVRPASEVDWAQPSEWSVFCSGPIPSPMDIYVLVHDFLAERGAFKAPEDFLNRAERLSTFVGITSTSGFLLGTGPACIRDLLCADLERQHVPHNVIHHSVGPLPGYMVRLGWSGFLCRTAEAIWAEGPH